MDCVVFKINEIEYSVQGCEVSSTVMLVEYLRNTLELRGTKYMCGEGGCGACVVAVTKSKGGPVQSVNACMVPITSCHEWEITTIEHLGNRNKGYHILQKTLAEYNGTQCGYCSPAWIMSMYSLLQKNPKPTKLEIERNFGGNVCRCTGYRPILDAFKQFSREEKLNSVISDIEDLSICKKTGETCRKTCNDHEEWCIIDHENVENENVLKLSLQDNRTWYKVKKISQVFEILKTINNESYMLVHGNTARGAYPILEYPNTLIDISTLPELKVKQIDQNLIVGAGLTITELEDVFNETADTESFEYLKILIEHIKMVAHVPKRNQASVGGNLMIKHQHNEFSSDLFLLFETVGAYVNILSPNQQYNRYSMQNFLKQDMTGRIIVQILLPPLSNKHKLVTFKIMPRAQNAHAIVNAGFLYELTDDNKVKEARIVYGGLSPTFIRASDTERYLQTRPLFVNATLRIASGVLRNELIVEEHPPEPSAGFRKQLAISLFYKGLLTLCPNSMLMPKYRSGGLKIHLTRPVSQGTQKFDTDSSLWPLNQPIPKIEGLIQCAGETKYTDDIPIQPNEVYAAFVLSTVGTGTIQRIDATAALNYPGVLAFYSASDIPGLNSFTPGGLDLLYLADEEIFCSSEIKYYNQPIGVIVAESHAIAMFAAKMIFVSYTNTDKPMIVDVKDAAQDPNKTILFFTSDATDHGNDIAKNFSGETAIYGQYHFTLENIACVTIPTEEGLAIYPTSHWIDSVQWMASRALNIPKNRIDVYVRRLGGSFGIKLIRSTRMAIACSLVALKLNRPCRLVTPLTDTMRAVGKRYPSYTRYEGSVNNQGLIQSLNYQLYDDNGYIVDEALSSLIRFAYDNCYTSSRWNFKLYDALTDTAKNTWLRGPGTFEAVSHAELLMERISYEISGDPFDVRLANLDSTKYDELRVMAEDLRKTAFYNERKAEVNDFNSKNRWTKKGIRVSFLRWTTFGLPKFDINLSVCHGDGTVILVHGGVEMGQGVNTQAVQVVAYYFKIPIDKVQIKANSTIVSPMSYVSGGSLTSQYVVLGVRRACLTMLKRLEPIRNQMDNPTWEQLIVKAYDSDVDLHVHEYVGNNPLYDYNIYGVAIAEVKVDILTGEMEITRVDLMQDCGRSVSPEIDVGQVEGAFIMGLGYWTSENLVYNRSTGELLTDRTWFYYVPLATDIPQSFNITIRKSYTFDEILGAKATGEPPMCLSIVIAFAIRAAIVAAREDIGIPSTQWFQIDGPFTTEKIKLAANTSQTDFKFK